MTNVTQKIPTLIGGVSRLADYDKQTGEVREAVNCYPDLSYGMTKRPGSEFIGALGLTEEQAEATYFFPIIREGRPRFLCGMRAGSVQIWDLDNGLTSVTVTGDQSAFDYLNYTAGLGIPANDAYRVTSDSRRTVIVNRTTTCQENDTAWEDSNPAFTWTIRLQNTDANSIEDLPDGRAIRINWGEGDPDPADFPTGFNALRPGIHYLPLSIKPSITNSGTTTKITNQGKGCVIKCTINDDGVIPYMGARVDNTFYPSSYAGEKDPDQYGNGPFYTKQQAITQFSATDFEYDAEIWSEGSGYADQTPCTVDGIPGASCTIATGLQPGQVYRVVNSGSNLDDFYMQPFSNRSDEDDTPGQTPSPRARIDGPYFWKECPSPDSYVGLDASTLPHELIDKGTSFEIRQIDYSDRWAGDNTNNPAPSFVGKRINNTLFLNNRLGFLAEDNVILSRPINYGPEGSNDQEYVPDDNPWIRRNYTEVDFFRQSAIQMTAADPIDMKSASVNTSVIHKAIPTPQGTLLFADGQQSLLFQPEGLLSPLTASINSVSNYDMTDDVLPIIIGETCYFVNKGANFCRVYSFVNRGMQNPPVIQDVTREVSDWLPNTLTDLKASLTDDMLLTYARDERTVYCRRVVTEDRSSWTKWILPDSLVELFVDHDEVFYLTKTDGNVHVHRSDMYVVPDDSSYVFAPGDLIDNEFNGIPANYNYSNKIIGRKQLKPGKVGTVEYYAPWHDYYPNGTQNQYDRWLSLDNIDMISAIGSSLYSIEVDTVNTDRWLVGYRIMVKLQNNTVEKLPSPIFYKRLPYDTIFRLNVGGSTTDADYIDGCQKTTECSMLQYMTPSGVIKDTEVWGTEVTDINTNVDPVVVTVQSCDSGLIQTTIPKSEFYDVFLLNINKSNCETDPDDYTYARLVIDDITLSAVREDQFGNTLRNPTTRIVSTKHPNNQAFYLDPGDESEFPIKTYWYQRQANSTENFMSTLAAYGKSSGNLSCPAVNWGRADEIFCQENPGKVVMSLQGGTTSESLISYSSSTNYLYHFSSNQEGGTYSGRPDWNDSINCSLTSDEEIGDYIDNGTNVGEGIIGRPWGTYHFIGPVTQDPEDWWAPGYSRINTGSNCDGDDKFDAWQLGGSIASRGIGQTSGALTGTSGWAFDGYSITTPPDPTDYASYGIGLKGVWVEFAPPPTGLTANQSEGDSTEYEQYQADFGQNPPGKLFIRSHWELSNKTDPYSGPPDAVLTDTDPSNCDSCPPVAEPVFPVEYKDLTITPYLDFYTNQVTLSTISEDNDASILRSITPPANYPYIQNLQPCLLIAKLPGQGSVTATDRAGYQVDLSWNETQDALISPIDLATYTGKIIIGYRYNYLIELPRFYFNDDRSKDYTASLTIARIKTALGYSGDCTLEVRANNNRSNWSKYFSATKANYYDADDSPITESSIHTLPVHRRTEDFFFRINSNSPFPLSVDSVTWEGNYSPRYYRRM